MSEIPAYVDSFMKETTLFTLFEGWDGENLYKRLRPIIVQHVTEMAEDYVRVEWMTKHQELMDEIGLGVKMVDIKVEKEKKDV